MVELVADVIHIIFGIIKTRKIYLQLGIRSYKTRAIERTVSKAFLNWKHCSFVFFSDSLLRTGIIFLSISFRARGD